MSAVVCTDTVVNSLTTYAIFRNAIVKCFKTELLEIPHAKVEIIKFLMALVCDLEKVGTVR